MSFDDLRQLWRNEINRPVSADEQTQLMRAVQQRCKDLERKVWIRDLLEIIAAIALIAGFVVMWSRFSRTWPSRIGAVGMCVWALGVIAVLIRSRHAKPLAIVVPASEFVRRKLEWCENQQQLLTSVQWWYVLPSLVSGLLIAWGSVRHGKEVNTSLFTLVVVAVAIWIVRLNHRAAAARFQPLKDDLSRLRDSL